MWLSSWLLLVASALVYAVWAVSRTRVIVKLVNPVPFKLAPGMIDTFVPWSWRKRLPRWPNVIPGNFFVWEDRCFIEMYHTYFELPWDQTL